MDLEGRFSFRRLLALRPDDGQGAAAPAEPPAQEPAAATPETPVAPTPEPAAAAPAAPSPGAGAQERIAELVAQRHAEKRAREAAEARAQLAEQLLEQLGQGRQEPGQQAAPQGTPVDPQELARSMAADMRFAEQCNAVVRDGRVAKPDFDAKLTSLKQLAGGGLPRSIAEAALATGKAADVIYALGSDANLADRVLGLPPLEQAVELARLAGSVSSAKPTAAPSSAPAPIAPAIGGGGSSSATKSSYSEGLSIDEWMALREKEVAGRASTRH